MDGSGTHRVKGDQGNCPDSPASVVGGQESHAPPVSSSITKSRATSYNCSAVSNH